MDATLMKYEAVDDAVVVVIMNDVLCKKMRMCVCVEGGGRDISPLARTVS